jgi:hypothetical protein
MKAMIEIYLDTPACRQSRIARIATDNVQLFHVFAYPIVHFYIIFEQPNVHF